MTFKQVQLPEYALTKGFKSPAHWVVKVVKHIESEKRIFCDILSYNIGDIELNYTQQVLDKIDDIEIVTFRDIDTGGFLRTLLGGTIPSSYVPSRDVSIDRPKHHHQFPPVVKEPYKRTIKETFSVPIKDVRFIDGGVTFAVKLSEPNKRIEFKVSNDDIREEFDSVKNYFANVLNTKKIQVNATIEFSDDIIISQTADSPEINKINKELFENVKLELVNAIKKVTSDSDSNMLTMEDCFENLAQEDIKSSIFYNDEAEFFDDILKTSNTKHHNHLRYLSSKHAYSIMKLRYIGNPFSFIFLIQGDRHYHLIWETLNTAEATYIWHMVKDSNTLESILQKLEHIMGLIKVQGKKGYLKTAKEPLTRIYHDYSENASGFARWKEELEHILT